MSDYHTLVQIEVGGNQRYIFESDRLRDIRGASALLDRVNRQDARDLVEKKGGEVIRATGGVIVARFDDGDDVNDTIDELEREIRALYAREIPGASLYSGRIRYKENKEDNDFVANLFTALSLEKSMDQWSNPGVDGHPFLGGPMIKFCQACGVRPVDTIWPLEEEFICSVCDSKRCFGEKSRRGEDGSEDDPDMEPSDIVQKFFAYVQDEKKDPRWLKYEIEQVLPRDFDEMGRLAGGQIGMLMADGNRLGQTLQGFDTIEKYKKFSVEIANLVERAVFEVLRDYPPEEPAPKDGKENGPKREILPWELIFMGGDDISLVASADIVLEIGIKIMEKVEEATKETMKKNTSTMADELQRPHLSMAGGVAVGPPHFPVQSLNKLAKALEKRAKKKAFELREEEKDKEKKKDLDPSTIDFHRVTASGNTDLDHVRKNELQPKRPAKNETVELTHRPYEINECKRILNTARLWRTKKLPGSKVHLLYDALFESPATAMYTWARVVGRAKTKDAEHWRELESIMQQLEQGDEFLMPWYVDMTRVKEGRDRYRNTYLLDVIEAWSMLPKTKQ